MPSTLKISISHRVGVVWMTRAQVRNAFNETMIAELTETFGSLGADPDVRAVVHDCLRHRVALSYEASASGLDAQKVVSEIVKLVAVA